MFEEYSKCETVTVRCSTQRCLLISAYLVLGSALWSQQPSLKDTAFEVASIRASQPDHVGSSTATSNGEFRMTNMPLRRWLEIGFGMQDYDIKCPPWLSDKHFDLVAKLPDGANTDRIGDMLKTLLIERFQLRFHKETRTTKGLALIRGKKDPKLKLTTSSGRGGTSNGPGMVSVRDMTLVEFAKLLSAELRSPVVEKTGIEGSFDITLRWNPGEGLGTGERSSGVSIDAPSLAGAVREQLGLELKAEAVMGPLLVVEHIAMSPSDN